MKYVQQVRNHKVQDILVMLMKHIILPGNLKILLPLDVSRAWVSSHVSLSLLGLQAEGVEHGK